MKLNKQASRPSSIKDHCESNKHWIKYVHSVNNANEWTVIANHIFDDHIVHEGHIEVLRYFTESIVDRLTRSGKRLEILDIAVAHANFSSSLQPLKKKSD